MSGGTSESHQFIYGRPVQPDEFLNRETELSTIFNRLRNSESSAIVGEPHIGKTSLLYKLADEATQQQYLENKAKGVTLSSLNLHTIDNDYTPVLFWEEALEPLLEHPGHVSIARYLKQASQAGYRRRSLERLFNQLAKQGKWLLLLLDEFERLFFHPNFQDFTFFAVLRSLSSSLGFSFVTTSRLPLSELNERGHKLPESGGSPLFNTQIEVHLRPFDQMAVDILLSRDKDKLSAKDRDFICRVAGRHPFLLQAMTAALIETTGNNRHSLAAERFYRQISSHFDDMWRTLDDRTRTTAVILSLVTLGGHAVGQNFAYGEIEQADAFGPELHQLAERGLAELVGEGWQFDSQNFLLWRGERWRVGTEAFAWWIRDVIIAETRRVPTYEEWVTNKRYNFFLTQEQWDTLLKTVRKTPDWAVRGVAALGRALFEELTRRKQ